MTTPREAAEMVTPAEMSWDHHIVAEKEQGVPEAAVAEPASATAEETGWAPRIVAPADDDRPLREPPISDPASAAEEGSSGPAALAPPQPPGTADLRGAAAEPGTATGPASPSAANGDGLNPDVRWHEILAMFVDDPRSSVEQAAALADDRAEAFVSSVKELQDSLRSVWQRHDVQTEELRIALQQYRIFCNRLEVNAAVL